jgi:hypothetical protein
MKINPKLLLFSSLLFCPLSIAYAQENDTLKDAIVVIDSTAEKEHKVTFTLDLVNRYIWRTIVGWRLFCCSTNDRIRSNRQMDFRHLGHIQFQKKLLL